MDGQQYIMKWWRRYYRESVRNLRYGDMSPERFNEIAAAYRKILHLSSLPNKHTTPWARQCPDCEGHGDHRVTGASGAMRECGQCNRTGIVEYRLFLCPSSQSCQTCFVMIVSGNNGFRDQLLALTPDHVHRPAPRIEEIPLLSVMDLNCNLPYTRATATVVGVRIPSRLAGEQWWSLERSAPVFRVHEDGE